jgi:hypothetical protein
MPTNGTGVVVVAVVVVGFVGVALVGVALVGVALVGVALVGVALVGVAVFNGSDGSVIGTTMLLRLLWLLCGTEIPMTALAVKWVLFAA